MAEEDRAIQTQLRHTLQELKSLESRLGTVTVQTVYGVLFVDEDDEILYANDAAGTIFGCSSSELLGRRYELPFASVQPKEFCFTTDDGRQLTLETWAIETDWCGKPGWFVGLHDITERKKAETSLARLAAIVDSSDDAIYAVELDGTITDWNKGAQRIYGFTAQEVVGRHVSVLAPPERRDEVPALLLRVSEGMHVDHFETMRVRSDGRVIYVSLTISPVREHQKIVGASIIVRDITEKKKAEEAVRRSEERLNVALDSVGMGCCEMDTASGTGMWSRQKFLLFGYPCPGTYQAPATSDMWLSLIVPEDHPGVLAEMKAARHERRLMRSEHRITRADTGDVVWISVLGRFLPAAGQAGQERFIGVAFDVTARKEAEQELVQARRLAEVRAAEALEGQRILDALMANSPDGVAVCDRENRIRHISSAGAAMLGVDQQALVGLAPPEYLELFQVFYADNPDPLAPEDLAGPQAAAQGVVVRDLEFRIRRKDASCVPVVASAGPVRDSAGAVAGSVIAWRDIAERKLMEEQLRESEERYRTLVEWAPDAVVVHRDGRFLYANCPALGLLGLKSRTQLDDKKFCDIVHPEDRELVREQLRQIEAGERMSPYEFRVMNHGGATVPVEASGIIICYEGAPAYLFIVRDITERKRLEQERLSAVQELHIQEQLLVKQARFAAMGEMIGNIAHQWRQPLNTLALIVQELPVFYSMGEFDQRYLDASVGKAMQVISHMSQTIDGFRNFFKPEKAKVRFSVKEVLEKSISMVDAAFTALMLKIEVVAEDEPYLSGYPNEFSQVILNILMNAKDAFMERRVEHPTVQVRLCRENGRVVATVRDNAGGIPEEIMDRIFEAYFSTKSPEKGTGIGLFMSKVIIEKNMGGSLTVCNVNDGAEFRIEVPEPAEEESPPAQ